MDNIQKILIVVSISLILLLGIVGFQVILVILDLRKALRRLNSILEDAILGGGLIRPDRLTGLVEMFKKDKSMETHGDDSSGKSN